MVKGMGRLPPEILKRLEETLDESGLRGEARQEVLRELSTHFEDGLAAGHSPEDLLRDFGDVKLLAQGIRHTRLSKWRSIFFPGQREGRISDWIISFGQDLRQAIRGLLRSPTYAGIAVLTLALGIGANTAVFSVVNGLLLRPLPFHDAGQLVLPVLTNPKEGVTKGMVGYADYLRWREETGIFQAVGLYLDWNSNLTGEDHPDRVRGAVVSHRFFEVLGAPPLLGRTFSPEEHERGGGQVVLLSQGLWERRFGSDPEVLGSSILLDEQSYRIVGVVAPEAQWPREADFWIPLTFGAVTPDWVLTMDARAYSTIARLQPGISAAQAAMMVDQTARRAATERPDTRAGFGATTIPLRTFMVGENTQKALWLLLACAGFVLLIASANVANLTLERSLSKHQEIAIRAALGAGLRRSVRPLAWESLVLATVGGALGVAGAIIGTRTLVSTAPFGIPGIQELSVDLRLLAFALLVTTGTGVLFTLFPSFIASRLEIRDCLMGAGPRAGGKRGGGQARRAISVIQLALSVILVLGASLTVKSTMKLLGTDPGFREENLLVMKLFLPHRAPTPSEGEVTAQRYRQFVERLGTLPGVVSASVVSALPLSADGLFDHLPFRAEESEGALSEVEHFANWNIVGVEFFETMGIELSAGRSFSAQDLSTSPNVVILSQSFARRLFPNQDPIGKRIRSLSEVVTDNPMEVVGIATDVRYTDMADAGREVVYVPLSQSAWRAMAVVVRFTTDPSGRGQEVREAIWAVDPSIPVTEVRTMEAVASESLASESFATTLVTIFATLALFLALIGVYGVVNFSLRQRRHELGVRRALGAQGRDIGRLLLGEGLKLVAMGVALGLPAALFLFRSLSGLLFEVRTTDPLILVGVPALLGLVAFSASGLPALRAAAIEPVEAMRGE
jgi:putative ABC transport system permease protein